MGKARYKPWPKLKGTETLGTGPRVYIDKEKIRQQYLAQDKYVFKDFCQASRYRFNNYHHDFPLLVWQQQWIQRRSEETMDSLVAQAMKVKHDMLKGRLDYIPAWGATATDAKNIVDFRITEWKVQMAIDGPKLQANIRRIEAGLAPVPYERAFTAPTHEIASLVNTAKAAQSMHREALLMTQNDAAKLALPVKDADPIVAEAEAEGERLRELGPALMDGSPLDEDVMTQMLNKWVDQQASHEVVEVDAEPSPNAPLTPLDDDE